MTDTKREKEVAPAKQDYSNLNLYQKLAAITGEIGSIAKDGKNKEQGYSFIEYSAVAGELRTLFAKYNVMVLPIMKTEKRTVDKFTTSSGKAGYHIIQDYDFEFINCDKPDEKQIIPWTGEAIDYGDKALNKTATGALKYCLMRTFNISEKGDDPDAHSPEAGTTQAAPAPKRKVTLVDAIGKIYAELASKGFATQAACKTALLTIAGVSQSSELTPSAVQHVWEVVTSTSGDELRGYLKAKESADVETPPEMQDDMIDLNDGIQDPFDH